MSVNVKHSEIIMRLLSAMSRVWVANIFLFELFQHLESIIYYCVVVKK